jgi:hypothetical protein
MEQHAHDFDLTGLPPEVASVMQPFAHELMTGLTDRLESIAVTGSCLTGDYMPGISDINTVLVLREVGLPELDIITHTIYRYRKKMLRPPLAITDEYIKRSLDVFPIEFLDLKLFHKTIYGPEKLAKLPIEKLNLRLQCERDLKGKLINLRRGYIICQAKPKVLKSLLLEAFPGFFPLLRAMLYLVRINTEPPIGKASVLEEAESVFDISMAGLKEILLMKAQKKIFHKPKNIHALFEEVCRITNELSKAMDGLSV